MVRSTMQERTIYPAERAVVVIHLASSSRGVVVPCALMEFVSLPVLIRLSVSMKRTCQFFRFAGSGGGNGIAPVTPPTPPDMRSSASGG